MVILALMLLAPVVARLLRKPAPPVQPVVSRNPAPYRRHSGPMWEQDAPFPECFEEDDL